MKTLSRIFLTLTLCSLSLPGLADSVIAPQNNYRRLVEQPDYRLRQQNRVIQEVETWKTSPQKLSERLFNEVQEHINLEPRHKVLRPAFVRMLASRKPAPGQPQEEELFYYKLLNLETRNATYQQKLSQLLLQKHGGHSAGEIKQAYTYLNQAFNTWDEGKYDQALRLFRQAQLKRSPELTAILAYHLRDRGQVAEAKTLLQNFQGQRSYLNWIDGMLNEIKAAEKILEGNFSAEDKLSAWITLGEFERAKTVLKNMSEGAMKHWYQAKLYEKQGQYHPASAEYRKYYQQRWPSQLKGFVPVIYKAQLEDVNSLDLIALKFRTSAALIREINEAYPHEWIETYRMLVIPVPERDLQWPTQGDYVSSHFGYRLHPIHGTWRLHEGVDIETMPGANAHAARGGTVVEARYDKECGNFVRLQHQRPDIRTVYCHGEKILVSRGAEIAKGRAVIETGNTGASASNHLHFGVQESGVFVNPMDWL